MAQPVKRVRTPSGIRYQRGGKFISKASAARSLAAKRKPKKKTTTIKKTTRKVVRKTVRKRAVAKRVSVSRKRSLAAKKAARTRAANARKRSEAAKKAARTRKRKSTAKRRKVAVTVKTNPKRRRKPVSKKRVRRNKMTKAAMSRRAKRAPRYNSGPMKGKFKPRGGAKRNPPKKRKSTSRKHKGRLSKQRILMRSRPGSSKRRTYRVRRTIRKSPKGKRYYTHSLVRQNPKKALMRGAGIYAGVIGLRLLSGFAQQYVIPRLGAIPASIAGILPAGLGFLGAIYLPKIFKMKQSSLLEDVKLGAAVGLYDALVKNLVVPSLKASTNPTMQTIATSLSGEFNVHVPLAEYLDYDNRYGEYLDYDNRYGGLGMEVHEALAGSGVQADEARFMQSGGAGGTLSRTVFSS